MVGRTIKGQLTNYMETEVGGSERGHELHNMPA